MPLSSRRRPRCGHPTAAAAFSPKVIVALLAIASYLHEKIGETPTTG